MKELELQKWKDEKQYSILQETTKWNNTVLAEA